jgi:hypothetical protein
MEEQSMHRRLVLSFGFLASVLLAAGCGSDNEAAKKVEDKAKKVGEAVHEGAKKVAEEAKDLGKRAVEDVKAGALAVKHAFTKGIEEDLPKLEEKMKSLSGASATKAKEAYAALKTKLAECKEAAPEKWESLKEGVAKDYEALKKLVHPGNEPGGTEGK